MIIKALNLMKSQILLKIKEILEIIYLLIVQMRKKKIYQKIIQKKKIMNQHLNLVMIMKMKIIILLII